jgi:peptide chain release factor subunit 1
MEMLPQEIQHKVLGVIDVPIDISRDELVEAGDAVLQESEHSEAVTVAEELKAAILKGGLAAYGLEDVKTALEQARVNTLVTLKDSSVPGWICEKCQNLQANAKPPKECERCGGPTSVVNVVEELYEMAQRTGAKVEFVEIEDFFDSDNVVGALLRY